MRIDRTAIVTAGLATVWLATVVVLFAATAGRLARRGTSPHEMGTQAHEEAARQTAAKGQRMLESPCPLPQGETMQSSTICWTPFPGTTGQRARLAEQQQRLAEAHRTAAAELRAEADLACAGVAEADRNTSPFSHLDDLDGAKHLRGPQKTKPTAHPRLGVTIFVRAVPGLTEEQLQRLVDCHLAQNALLGHVSALEPDCPLVPMGVTATVRSTGARFAVDIKGNSSEVGKEIEARTQRLVGNRWMEE